MSTDIDRCILVSLDFQVVKDQLGGVNIKVQVIGLLIVIVMVSKIGFVQTLWAKCGQY